MQGRRPFYEGACWLGSRSTCELAFQGFAGARACTQAPWPLALGVGLGRESQGKGEVRVGGNGPQSRWAPSLGTCFSAPPITIPLGLSALERAEAVSQPQV